MNFHKIKKEIRQRLDSVTHVIIKLGTGVITPHISDINQKKTSFFQDLALEVLKLQKQNKKVIIVSSGAVGLGSLIIRNQKTNLINTIEKNKNEDLEYTVPQKQALASLGQSLLIEKYQKSFKKQNIPVSQILVSKIDFQNKKHYANLKNTLDKLLDWQSVPIINENDAVATNELKLGDNDTLSASIATMFENSFLLMLSTTDGFYIQDKKIDYLNTISENELKHAGKAAKGGTGGMKTKLVAAQTIFSSKQIMNISNGSQANIISKLMKGSKIGTWFY